MLSIMKRKMRKFLGIPSVESRGGRGFVSALVGFVHVTNLELIEEFPRGFT